MGTTWIAIKFQLGVIAVEASIAYRFALASAIFFLSLSVTKRLSWIPLRQQPYVIAQGCCLFSFNFVCFYLATDYIPSGLVAVVFSTAAIFNSAIAFLVYGRRPSGQTLLAVFVGTLGVFFLFFPAFNGTEFESKALIGLALSMTGTLSFSLGTIVSTHIRNKGFPTASVNAYAMLYGAIIVCLFAYIRHISFSFDLSVQYVGSLLYLAVIGSVVALTTYLTVAHKLGPEKAAYMTVLFPVLAIVISIFAEGYQFTLLSVVGLLSILTGNVLMFYKGR